MHRTYIAVIGSIVSTICILLSMSMATDYVETGFGLHPAAAIAAVVVVMTLSFGAFLMSLASDPTVKFADPETEIDEKELAEYCQKEGLDWPKLDAA